MTIYISGPITNNPHYMQDFERVEKALLTNGDNPVNPAKVELNENATWADYMREDIRALTCCNAIFMLKGWWRSKGARLERYIAKKLGLSIIYER